ncbi:hypothetical protein F7725_005994 [Dissostichus mawsoni]|uniref:Uncharacterized protein n=1 Tax=Dissostichus mawsoni TaxID=36200 RepID=A0A7J5YV67_DISMA|nr:hypothetical protein F7725_005994 [Dissostichus mawsoni]
MGTRYRVSCVKVKVVQEEVEREDEARKAQDEQDQELEPREAANFMQDLPEPHGDEIGQMMTLGMLFKSVSPCFTPSYLESSSVN